MGHLENNRIYSLFYSPLSENHSKVFNKRESIWRESLNFKCA